MGSPSGRGMARALRAKAERSRTRRPHVRDNMVLVGMLEEGRSRFD